MMGPVLAACLLIILSTAWISQANEALCKKDGGVCSCNNNKNSVDCSSKRLTAIPSNIPTDTENLKLGYNKLQSLPHGVFDHLTKLTILWLNNNQLRRVPDGAFDSLSKLNRITLQSNPWDCSCNDILYLRDWIDDNKDKVTGAQDAACGDQQSKAVLDITEKDAASDCVSPNTTTAIPTSTTTPASVIYDDIHEIKVPQENFQKFLGYQEPDHLPTQPQCLMSISGYLGLMMSLMLTSAAILYVFHFLKKA
uniref:Variable lymphocyte receptor A n=1 Tax=Eptatretus burgeri TaxID=7764 RepID=Q32QZ2_EPTBU|nr:variable lymphocyte receptor A [Eptatretus burgeri]